MPKVSVIITTCNRGRFVLEALESVLSQAFKDFEIIVVDDGSTDDTPRLLKKYASSIYYVYQRNQGRSAARNSGIRLARGEYIAFLDDDDIWLPGKLERQVVFLDSHGETALAHTFTELMDEYSRPLEKETKKHLRSYRKATRIGYTYEGMSRLCVMYTSSVMIRKACFARIGFFDSNIEAFEDWDIYLRFALEYKISSITETLVRIRIHPAHSTQDEFTWGRIKVSRKHLSILDSLGDSDWIRCARYNFYLHLAKAYYISGDIQKSRQNIILALKLELPVLARLSLGLNLWVTLLFPRIVNKLRQVKAASLRGKGYGYPQRIIPQETSGGPLASHIKRYEFAAGFCEGKVVLDAACGVGYGSARLSAVAREVTGVDKSAEAVIYAQGHYRKENIRFQAMDVCSLGFPDGYFDIVCSFETLEHLERPLEFLAQVKRVLKEDGMLIISTPNAKRTVINPANPYHKVEFSREDFNNALRKYFSRVDIFGQRRRQSPVHYWIQKIDVFNLRGLLSGALRRGICHSIATRSWDEAGLDDFIIGKQALNRSTELIAVCGK